MEKSTINTSEEKAAAPAPSKFHKNKKCRRKRLDARESLVSADGAFAIKKCESMGRYLVASKLLKAGQVILSELPLVVGPCFGCQVTCLGCYKSLVSRPSDATTAKRDDADADDSMSYVTCCGCGWPLCGHECPGLGTKYGHSEAECCALSEGKSGCRLEYADFSKMRQQFHSIMPLRCLLLKGSTAYEVLMSMESHANARRQIPEVWQDTLATARRITQDWGLRRYDEEEIFTICGILGVNAFEIGQGQISLRGVYPTASLMSHDCVANTNHVDENLNYRLTVRTSVDIPAGGNITVNYVNPLQGTVKRREEIMDNKYFWCACKRCCDPTELGTFSSALICPKCQKGYILPVNPTNLDSNWTCNNSKACTGYIVKAKTIRRMIDKISDEAESLGCNDIGAREAFLEKYRNVLHPTHYVSLNVKLSLSQLYGKIQGYIINDLSEQLLQRKLSLCEEALRVLDVIEPGHTRIRGVTLYELHAPIMVMTTAAYGTGAITKVELRRRLKRILDCLRSAVQILRYEPEGSYEYDMCCGAKRALERIGDWEKIVGKLSKGRST